MSALQDLGDGMLRNCVRNQWRPCRVGVLNAEPGGGRAPVPRSGAALTEAWPSSAVGRNRDRWQADPDRRARQRPRTGSSAAGGFGESGRHIATTILSGSQAPGERSARPGAPGPAGTGRMPGVTGRAAARGAGRP
jgi:hypothetical protein